MDMMVMGSFAVNGREVQEKEQTVLKTHVLFDMPNERNVKFLSAQNCWREDAHFV